MWRAFTRFKMAAKNFKVKRSVVPLMVLLASVIWLQGIAGMPNPAAVYCIELGYEYTSEMTEEGEAGFCNLPDGQKVSDWPFLQGKVGQEFSYCAKEGYEIKTISDPEKCVQFMLTECAVCVLEDDSEVEVTQLMELSFGGPNCGDGTCVQAEDSQSCPEDCPISGPDGYCDALADSICDYDCEDNRDPDCEEETLETLGTSALKKPEFQLPSYILPIVIVIIVVIVAITAVVLLLKRSKKG